MDIGMPTLMEHRSLEECAILCKKLQMNFIELNMNLLEFQTDRVDVDKLNRIREKEGIYFTFHLDENLNVCDLNPKVADAYRKTVMETIAIAKRIKAPILNMHLTNGVYFTLPEKKIYVFSQYYNHYMNKLCKFRDRCEKAIGSSNIKICIENAEGFQSFARDGIELLLESKVFGLTFDIGHNYLAKKKDESFIMQHSDRLLHMHVHDAIGKQDHLPLGQGEINLNKKFQLARDCDCRIVFESKTEEGLKKTIARLSQYDGFKSC